MKLVIRLCRLLGSKQVAAVHAVKRYRVLLESEDISKSCYRAESFFDGRLIVAHCFKVNAEGSFYLNDHRDDVEREIRIGTGRIITVT